MAISGNKQPLMIQGFVLLDDAPADVFDNTDVETVMPYPKSSLLWKVSLVSVAVVSSVFVVLLLMV